MQANVLGVSVLAAGLLAGFGAARAQSPANRPDNQQIAREAASVLKSSGDGGSQARYQATQPTRTHQIPQQYINAARCVAVFPAIDASWFGSKEGGLTYGQPTEGIVDCRNTDGTWVNTAPAFITLTTGTIRAQRSMQTNTSNNGLYGRGSGRARPPAAYDYGGVGARPTYEAPGNELVVLFVNNSAVTALKNGHYTLATDIFASAPDPVTPTNMAHVQVVAYRSNKRDGFSSVDITGAKVYFDKHANARAYGKGIDANKLLNGTAPKNATVGKFTPFTRALAEFAPESNYREFMTTSGG